MKAIARESFEFIASSAVETLFYVGKPEMLKERAVIENKHILNRALSKGKGVILVSGHFGNFPLMILRLRFEGYSIGGIMRTMRDPKVEKMFANLRNKMGIRTILTQPRKACVDATIRALRDNEVICLQLDQNFGTGGIFVDFFGQKAATATGPVIFALRTKAVLIPCFIVKERNNTHRIILEQEIDLKQEKDFDKTVQVNIQRLTGIIESYVRRYPSQWGWVHRRWKTRPQQNA